MTAVLPHTDLATTDPDAAGRWLIDTLATTGNPLAFRMVQALEGASPIRLELADIIIEEWSSGRTVLIGDAAAGFPPTAGIGAWMAMESAAVLADELSRADAATVEQAIDRYITRRRQRVTKAHSESRRLATLMGLSEPAGSETARFRGAEDARPMADPLHSEPHESASLMGRRPPKSDTAGVDPQRK